MKCELTCCLNVEDPALSDITQAVSKLMGFLKDHGVEDSVFLSEFELAAAEAINNAVEHGCVASPSKFFHARLYLRNEFVELHVLDPSDFSGWNAPPELPDDPLSEGGRGHFLMSQMTDEISHRKENGRHVIVLRKFFKSGSWQYFPGHTDQLLNEMTEELVSSYEMISTLLGLGEWLATASDLDAFTVGALRRLCEVTGAQVAYVRLLEDGELKLIKQAGQGLAPAPRAIAKLNPGVEAEVFRTGNEITLPMGQTLPPHDPLANQLDSGFVAPVLFKDRREGILVLGQTEPSSFFDAGKLKIARVVAEYLGIVRVMHDLQRRRVTEDRALHDLEIASQIQLSLMPREITNLPGLDICGRCLPALEAGGDYFDVLPLPGGAVLFIIADVMGKGLPAALLATMLRTNLRAIVAGGESDPGQIITLTNKLMCPDLVQLEMFITMSCAWVAPARDIIRTSGAGHLPGLLLRPETQPDHDKNPYIEISGAGIPLGIFLDSSYSSEAFAFAPGDRLILLTDGIIEACSPNNVLFDAVGLRISLIASKQMTSGDAVERLLADVTDFTQGASPSDDRTVLMFRRTD